MVCVCFVAFLSLVGRLSLRFFLDISQFERTFLIELHPQALCSVRNVTSLQKQVAESSILFRKTDACVTFLFHTIVAVGHPNQNRIGIRNVCAKAEITKEHGGRLQQVGAGSSALIQALKSDKMKCNHHKDWAVCTPLRDLSLIWVIVFVCLLKTPQNVFILLILCQSTCKYCKLSYCCYCVCVYIYIYGSAGMERTAPHHLHISKDQAFCSIFHIVSYCRKAF